MMARFGMKWGIALVSLMLLGGCLQEDPAGPDAKSGKDLLTRGGDDIDDGSKDTCVLPPDSGWACTMEYAPVCGVDGKTYGNRCMASVAKVEIAKEGACSDIIVDPIDPIKPIDPIDPIKPIDPIDPGEGWACIALWDPVCGKDGKTYGNSCEAHLVGVDYNGPCK